MSPSNLPGLSLYIKQNSHPDYCKFKLSPFSVSIFYKHFFWDIIWISFSLKIGNWVTLILFEPTGNITNNFSIV